MTTRFRERVSPVRLLQQQNVNSSAVNGDAIVNPWKLGRVLAVMAIAGVMTTNDAITIKVQRRRTGTSTWDDVFEPNGSTALAFTQQTNVGVAGTKAGVLKNAGVLFGEIDLTALKTTTQGIQDASTPYEYDAIRLSAINAAAQNVSIGAIGLIGDLYQRPEGTVLEDLYDKQRYTAGNANNG